MLTNNPAQSYFPQKEQARRCSFDPRWWWSSQPEGRFLHDFCAGSVINSEDRFNPIVVGLSFGSHFGCPLLDCWLVIFIATKFVVLIASGHVLAYFLEKIYLQLDINFMQISPFLCLVKKSRKIFGGKSKNDKSNLEHNLHPNITIESYKITIQKKVAKYSNFTTFTRKLRIENLLFLKISRWGLSLPSFVKLGRRTKIFRRKSY